MYKDKIRNLEKIVESQTTKISSLSKGDPEYITLIGKRSDNLQELSRLRKLQWEEDYERVRFDDDR